MSNPLSQEVRQESETNSRSAASLKRRASGWTAWRCAGLASLALAGCVVANVAGCGGGGGGSSVIPTPTTITATIQLLNTSGLGVNGTVTLGNRTLTTANSRAVFTGLQPGTFPLVFTVGGVTTRTAIAVSRESNQFFVAVPGLSNVSSNGIRVSGRTLLNSPSNGATAACNTGSTPVTSALLIRVRSLNIPGRPIVSSMVRPASANGNYIIFTIPSPGTYRVEARAVNNTSAPFAGVSPSFTIRTGQTEVNLNICVNLSDVAPGDGTPPPPPGTPTPDPNATGTPNGTPNGTPGATSTPGGTPAPTNTPGGTPAPTNTPGGVPTTAPNPTATSTPEATATPTVTPGGLPTPTPTLAPTPTPNAPGVP
jgi:hypothetical protein